MKRVAILGGGPAGAFAAERLASAGMKTVLFDEKLAWEKPCGGGLTYKAYEKYPFLIKNDRPKRLVTVTQLAAPGAGAASMNLRQPMVIYSRYELNRMLLARAEEAGAEIEQARVLALDRNGDGWRLRTRHGSLSADFCIVATGARNPLPGVGTELTSADTMLAMGYYVPEEQEHIDIQFFPQLEGYIWVFPRCGHLSVGICGKGEPARRLRARLDAYMEEKGISGKNGSFYSHVLPSLGTPAWRRNRVAGEGWLAVGDAGGLVDPITGEGLYYAMRSGDLASQVVLSDVHAPDQKPHAYRALLERDFAANLEFGAALARRLFKGSLLCASVPQRMIQFMRRSPKVHDLMQDLFAGTQGYLDLKARLLRNLHGTMLETTVSFLLSRLVPGET
ncbi:MAG TPA: NAD(P)/FAD-dependent oxidoreductase [Bryobacteraceae bacterium]|nr:NAD(P)/FAD-dependent oxidoreductase [Bryobacteraceae bacterium]